MSLVERGPVDSLLHLISTAYPCRKRLAEQVLKSHKTIALNTSASVSNKQAGKNYGRATAQRHR